MFGQLPRCYEDKNGGVRYVDRRFHMQGPLSRNLNPPQITPIKFKLCIWNKKNDKTKDLDSAATTIYQNNNLMDIDNLIERPNAPDKKNNNDNLPTWLTRELNGKKFSTFPHLWKKVHGKNSVG
uniref:Uncharacterized protein n=1 Tax=Romanomermis culicivorax TaxID=13658 RepID=A0A915LBG4_ROMCU